MATYFDPTNPPAVLDGKVFQYARLSAVRAKGVQNAEWEHFAVFVYRDPENDSMDLYYEERFDRAVSLLAEAGYFNSVCCK